MRRILVEWSCVYIWCVESDSDLVGYVAGSYNLICSVTQTFLGV